MVTLYLACNDPVQVQGMWENSSCSLVQKDALRAIVAINPNLLALEDSFLSSTAPTIHQSKPGSPTLLSPSNSAKLSQDARSLQHSDFPPLGNLRAR